MNNPDEENQAEVTEPQADETNAGEEAETEGGDESEAVEA